MATVEKDLRIRPGKRNAQQRRDVPGQGAHGDMNNGKAQWYQLESQSALMRLNASEQDGLSGHEAAQRQQQFGPNELRSSAARSTRKRRCAATHGCNEYLPGVPDFREAHA